MNITLIIIILLTFFMLSLILLNLKKIKEFFAKFKKSKKKKNSKGKGKKGKDGKNVKLQKSPTQTRPVVKPAEEKKPEVLEEQNKEDLSSGNKEIYKEPIKPIVASSGVPSVNSNNSYSNAIVGSKFNKAPNTLKDDLDKEFDEIRRFIDSSPNTNAAKKTSRPSFFDSSTSNSQFKNSMPNSSQFIQANRPNPYGLYNQNAFNPNPFNQNVNSNVNPFMQNGFVQNKPPMFNNSMSLNHPTDLHGTTLNNTGFLPNITANKNPNITLNPPSINPFVQKTNNFNINNNFAMPKKDKTNMPANAFNSFNLDNMSENSTAKVIIDDDEIDLNKLSPRVKKLIISNILARKNFDD